MAKVKANKKHDEGFQPSHELDRLVSLAGGEFAYLRDPRDGRLHHLRVGSPRWDLFLEELLNSPHGPRILKELQHFHTDEA